MSRPGPAKAINIIINFLLNYVLQPTFFIASFGPSIVSGNYNMVVNYFRHVKEIEAASQNPYTYALVSYHTQYFVLFLSYIFFIAETAVVARNSFRQENAFHQLASHFESHTPVAVVTKSLCIAFIALFTATFWAFASGLFVQTDVTLYQHRYERSFLWFKHFWPPPTAITWFRGAFIIYGIFLSIWKAKVFSGIFSNEQKK